MDFDTVFFLLAVVLPLIEIAGILTAIHAVFHVRTAQGAAAWVISLITFPWLALPAYAVFGRNKFRGYVSLRSNKSLEIRHVIENALNEGRRRGLVLEPRDQAEKGLVRISEMPYTRGNRLQLLINGHNTFDRIFQTVENARDYLLVQFYIVRDDQTGRRLKAALIRRAAAGLKVFFLYDEIGCHRLPDAYLSDLRQAGVETSAFNASRGKTNRFQLNFRNHRKIVLADGATALIGGHNVGDEYLGRHPRLGRWRDTHLMLAGPAVLAAQFSFVEDWYWATGEIPSLNWRPTAATAEDDSRTLVAATGPADRLETCQLLFLHLINNARRRLWIASPYFVPDVEVTTALQLAALRGVDVRLLLPERPDHRLVHLASFAYYHRILPLGIRLYRYTAGFMHQKVLLADDTAAVGTANLDNRSFRLNFEITAFNDRPEFVEQVVRMLQSDFVQSRPAAMEDYTGARFIFKLAVRSARLLAPIL
jgi:cardiolipin synthase